MIKFLVLIAEAIFFLTIGLLYYYAPESSYFWDDGFGGSIFDIYSNISDTFMFLIPSLLFFNILTSWLGLIKEINKWIMPVVYIELMGIIAMIPSVFMFYEFFEYGFLLLSIILGFAIFSFILLLAIKKNFNPQKIIKFSIVFTIISVPTIFIVMAIIAYSGAV